MRRTTAAIGMGAIGAAAWGLRRLARRAHHVDISMDQATVLPADVIIARLADVRGEPAVIPFVRSVEVLLETPQSAEYIVGGRVLGVPWWVRYSKQWDYRSNSVTWRSLDGMYGIENSGRVQVLCRDKRNLIRLTTGYSVRMSAVGLTIERIMKPLLAYAFGVWLKRLSR